MKVGLIDLDSKIPNLALMKLSAYFKNKGDDVSMTSPLAAKEFHKVYASKVFSFSALYSLPQQSTIGGNGFDPKVRLPEDIEHMMPDYSLYPGIDYSMGFTSRGCIRKCKFCTVHITEGLIHPVADIYEFWNPDHKKIVLLDNNILSMPEHFRKISGQLMKEDLKVDFNQGLDIRFLNEENVKILSRLKSGASNSLWRFAFDSLKYEAQFRAGAELLLKHFRPGKIMVYVLAGFDESFEDAMKRFEIVWKEFRFIPFVMNYVDPAGNKKMGIWGDFARWANKMIFKSCTFEEYGAL